MGPNRCVRQRKPTWWTTNATRVSLPIDSYLALKQPVQGGASTSTLRAKGSQTSAVGDQRSGMFLGMNSGQAIPSMSRILPLTHDAAGDEK